MNLTIRLEYYLAISALINSSISGNNSSPLPMSLKVFSIFYTVKGSLVYTGYWSILACSYD